MRRFNLVIFLLLCLPAIGLYSQTWEKVSVGLSAPKIVDAARNDQNHIFITTPAGEVYRSLDSGTTWSRVLYVPKQDFENVVGVNPVTQHVFVGTRRDGIWRSTDNGNNWIQVNSFSGGFWDVTFDAAGNIIFAAGDFGGPSGFIMQSTDGGTNWTSSGGFATTNRVTSVAVTATGVILAGSVSNGVYRSTDNGQTWAAANTGLTGLEGVPGRSMSVIDGNVFMISDNKLFRSTNNGSDWNLVDNNWTSSAIVKNPWNGHLFGAGGNSVRKSTNGGSTWADVGTTVDWIRSLVMMTSGRMLAVTFASLEVSTNGGVTWAASNGNLDASTIEGLVATSSGYIVAGSANNGIYRSTNAGLTWQNVRKTGNDLIPMALINPANGDIYVPYNKINRSTDQGTTWTQYENGLDGLFCWSIAIDPSNGNLLTSGTTGVFRSTDQGVNWTSTGTFPSPVVNQLQVKGDGTIFALSDGVIYRSTNAGANWTNIKPADADYIGAIGLDASGNIIIGEFNGARRSTDNGTTWEPRSTNNNEVTNAFSRFSNGVLYSAGNAGLSMSLDDGISWKTVALNGMSFQDLRSITYRPTDGKIYLGTNGDGIYRSSLATQLVSPSLSAPTGGATGVSITPSISWGNVSGADSFLVQISTSGSFTTIVQHKTVKSSPFNVSSALSAGTQYYVRVRAFDNIGGSPWSATTNFTTVFSPPNYSAGPNVSPSAPSEGQAITVTADIGNQPSSVILTYGKGGETGGTDVTMNLTTGTTYSGTIPGSAVTAKGVWYRVRALNNGGTTYAPSQTGKNDITVTITSIATVKASGQYPTGIPTNGYYSVGLPVNTTVDLSSIFGAPDPKVWKAWYAQNGSFVETTTMDNPTRGYIVLHRSSSPKDLTITSSTTNSITAFDNISLSPGWNFISWPYAFAANVSLNPSLIGSMWLYNGKSGWQAATQLKPFGAYAVYNKGGSAITVGSAVTWTSAAKTIAKTGKNWNLRLKVKAGEYSDEDNFISVNRTDAESYDEPEPIYIDDYVSGYILDENKRYSGKNSDKTGAVYDFVVENKTKQRNSTLSWEFSDATMAGYAVDLTENRVLDLNAAEQYSFKNDELHRFKIVIGTNDFVKTKVGELMQSIPKEFSLSQNYPNPFNPETTIQYNIARTGRVALRVYNVLGQEVRTLVNGTKETGVHHAVWDGKNNLGQNVASGIYIYRLEAGSFTQTKKLMFVK